MLNNNNNNNGDHGLVWLLTQITDDDFYDARKIIVQPLRLRWSKQATSYFRPFHTKIVFFSVWEYKEELFRNNSEVGKMKAAWKVDSLWENKKECADIILWEGSDNNNYNKTKIAEDDNRKKKKSTMYKSEK